MKNKVSNGIFYKYLTDSDKENDKKTWYMQCGSVDVQIKYTPLDARETSMEFENDDQKRNNKNN